MKLSIPLPLVDRTTGMRRTAVRFPNGQPPAPNGCRWCGINARGHGRQWSRSAQWHQWTHPTAAQILARMRAQSKES